MILRAQYTPDDEARRELSEWGGDWGDQRDWLSALALAMHEGGRDGAAVPESRVRAVWWREVILLTHGFAQSDYRPFAGELLDWLSSRPEGDAEAHLAGLELAGAALLELERPDPEQRRQAERLGAALRVPAAPVLLRARADVTLAHLGEPRVEVLDPDEMQFCFVPRGEFWLGSGEEDEMAYDDEKTKGRPQRYKLDYGYRMPAIRSRTHCSSASWKKRVTGTPSTGRRRRRPASGGQGRCKAG